MFGAGVGATLVLACGHHGQASEASGDLPGGSVKDLGVGTLRVVSGQPVVVARDDQGVYAMSTICTHASCDMTTDGDVTNGGMRCSCHGSTFDAAGRPTGGPARSPVRHFAVEIATDGTITIHADTVVSVDTRVPVSMT